jgi:HEAT repeat protein
VALMLGTACGGVDPPGADDGEGGRASVAATPLSPGAHARVAALCAALDSESVLTQIAAARALGAMGRLAEPAVPELILTAAGSDSELLAAVAEALGSIGDGTSEVAATLRLLAGNDVGFVRQAAARSLVLLGHDGRDDASLAAASP